MLEPLILVVLRRRWAPVFLAPEFPELPDQVLFWEMEKKHTRPVQQQLNRRRRVAVRREEEHAM